MACTGKSSEASLVWLNTRPSSGSSASNSSGLNWYTVTGMFERTWCAPTPSVRMVASSSSSSSEPFRCGSHGS